MLPLLTLASLLAAAGEVPAPAPEVVVPRLRGGIGVGGIGAYDFRFRTIGLVPALHGELGVTINRIGLVGSVAWGSVAVMTDFAGGLRVDWDVNAIVRLGFGAEVFMLATLDGPGAVSLGWSASAGFLVWSQPYQASGRQGLEVFLRVVPALTVAGSPGRSRSDSGVPFTLGGVVGFGYAWR
jgi:hypothetical protein